MSALSEVRETLKVGVEACRHAERRLAACQTEAERIEAEQDLHDARIWLAGIARGVYSRLEAAESL